MKNIYVLLISIVFCACETVDLRPDISLTPVFQSDFQANADLAFIDIYQEEPLVFFTYPNASITKLDVFDREELDQDSLVIKTVWAEHIYKEIGTDDEGNEVEQERTEAFRIITHFYPESSAIESEVYLMQEESEQLWFEGTGIGRWVEMYH